MSHEDIIKERLEKRLTELSQCKSPTELAFAIWTAPLEEAMGSRTAYRHAFIVWVEAYKENVPPKEWHSYKTPEAVANAIWNPAYDKTAQDIQWYGGLRSTLVAWIKAYKTST